MVKTVPLVVLAEMVLFVIASMGCVHVQLAGQERTVTCRANKAIMVTHAASSVSARMEPPVIPSQGPVRVLQGLREQSNLNGCCAVATLKFQYVSSSCGTPCTQGTYGSYCVFTCGCQNGAHCDASDGSCTCTTGWTVSTIIIYLDC